MVTLTHQIAGISIRTESDVLINYVQGDLFKGFRVSNNEYNARLKIQQFDRKSFILPPLSTHERLPLVRSVAFPEHWLDNPIFRSPEVRKVVKDCLAQPDQVHIVFNWNRAIFRNYAHNVFHIFYPPEKKDDFSNPIFNAGYRNFIAALLPNFSAVLIHGAGIIHKNRAVVFLAPDDGGKTTIVNHSSPGTILSDDQIILRREDDRITVHSTPFGEIGDGPQQARLGGLFLLEKAPHFELTPLKPREILRFIWNEQFYGWFVLPRNLRVKAFEILYDACCQVPVHRMRFPKDYVDWNAIDAAMDS